MRSPRHPVMCGLAFAGLLALAPLPATAAGQENALKACLAEETIAAERLEQCDAAIASGQFKHRQLALALTQRGFARGQQQNYAGAIADFDAALRHYPDLPQAYWFRGTLWALTNDLDRALADLDRAVELAPGSAVLRRTRARIHSQRNEHARAIDDLTTAISLAPRPHVEYTLRAWAHAEAGEREKAIADYRKALEIDPGYDLARKGLALLDAASPEALQLPGGKCSEENVPNQERAAACAAALESGTLAAGPRSIAYCNLGYALTELGEYDRVIESSDTALRLDPNSACAHLNRGRAWYYKGDIDRAIADYTQAIRLDSTFHEAYASRGTAYHERRDFAHAVANYDAAIAINPDFAPYYSYRGNSRFQAGDADRAIVDLTRAIELDPAYAPAYARRGHAYLAVKDLARAEADFDKALELAPGDAYARAGRAQIHDRETTPDQAAGRPDRELSFEKFRRLVQPQATAD